MGTEGMARMVGPDGATSKTHARKILKFAIKQFKAATERDNLDDKKTGVVGRKMYRDNWGYDELSAEVQWVGLNYQLIVICEYFLRHLDNHTLAQTKKHFNKLSNAKLKNKDYREVHKHQMVLFYRLNEAIEGALR